ncbi:putative nucleotidyltransferase component of viral defense system [Lachnospiraceae bacterium PM6-15]|uniref:nucleotidyl transferase AbiEii/AbiGii toxin family protein n=1 Tax=Ohessyouella blattaphilus TaxID=2949333 RepID=UPI003E2D79EB
MQLKAIIKNISKEKSISAQLVLQNYMLERLLERISKSEYNHNLILKGGFLIASMVGLDTRATMDMTIKGEPVTIENVESIFNEIIQVVVDDGVSFEFKRITEIREDDEYSGFRVHLLGNYPPMSVPLKLDITTGDVITPKEIKYEYKQMIDGNKSIPVFAYNLETILAEKLETILSRGDQTTRLRDYYDIYILWKLQRSNINVKNLKQALLATAEKRNTLNLVSNYCKTMEAVSASTFMHEQWEKYQRSFEYARGIMFTETCVMVTEVIKSLGL